MHRAAARYGASNMPKEAIAAPPRLPPEAPVE